MNLSRYLTLRINLGEYQADSALKTWIGRRLRKPAAAEGKVMAESSIVRATALCLARPPGTDLGAFITDPMKVVSTDRVNEAAESGTGRFPVALSAAIERAVATTDNGFNMSDKELTIFLSALGEWGVGVDAA